MNFELDQADIDRIAEAVAARVSVPASTQWLTRAEAAKHIRRSTKYLDGLVRRQEIPVHYPDARPLFLARDLDEYVHQTRRET